MQEGVIDSRYYIFAPMDNGLENSPLRERIVGSSSALKAAVALADKASCTDAAILLTGESGTGKELFVRAIHYQSHRRQYPLIAVNCAVSQETLVESELFGYERGAFTGAEKTKPGRFELAHKGTLFLDEIADMPLTTQAKVLRAIQEHEFERLGGIKTISVDVRIIAATNKNLEELVNKGLFREDLYYRIAVYPIHLPPLRERRADLPMLINYFALKFSRKMGKKVRGISMEALNDLVEYKWVGNIRELQNAIERTVILCQDELITASDIPGYISTQYPASSSSQSKTRFILPVGGISLHEEICELIRQAMERTKGNVCRSAQLLGLTRSQLRYKLKKYKITKLPVSTH